MKLEQRTETNLVSEHEPHLLLESMLIDLVVKQSFAGLEHEIIIVFCVCDPFVQLGGLGYRRRFELFGDCNTFRGLVGHRRSEVLEKQETGIQHL